MTLVPLDIPPGVWRNGTEYDARGRWYETNLVRWRNGSLRPIGGSTEWSASDFTGIARGIHAWTDNSGNRWLALGTAANLYVYDDSQGLTDITPASGFTAGSADANFASGYGDDVYGSYAYGTARPDGDALTLATTWALDSWGEYLVACSDGDGDLWEWQLNTGANAAQIANSPTGCVGLVVTQERFLFALGAASDPRRIDWCDQEDNTTWTAAADNQAGSFTLETDGEIRCGVQMPNETVILTSTDAWAARYIGNPLVYSFRRVGKGCGAIANRTAVRIDNRCVWLGYGGFFLYDGFVKPLQCDVWDYFKDTLSSDQASKVFGWHNNDFNEAWWLFPSDSTNECDKYLVWNYVEDWWAFGNLARSCGVGRAVFQTPMLAGTDQKVYQHEIGYDQAAGETPYAESGPIEIGNGERRAHVTHYIPDESTLGDVQTTFKTREYPTASETDHGPYTSTEPTSVRFSGRQFKIRVDATVEQEWRFGRPRVEVRNGGKR